MYLKMMIISVALLYSSIFGPVKTQESSGPMQPEEVVDIDLGEGMSVVEITP